MDKAHKKHLVDAYNKSHIKQWAELTGTEKSVHSKRISESIIKCRRAKENGTRYRCNEHWCANCNEDKWNDVVREGMAFTDQFQTPAFVTILLQFIKTPMHSSHKRVTNAAIKSINTAGVVGIWYPEIAFKGDKPKQIDSKTIGYDKSHQYLVHMHGIIDLSSKDLLKETFPLSNQVHVTEIGVGSYRKYSMEQNIINVIKYSTKKNWKASDVAIIESNANGFGYKLT